MSNPFLEDLAKDRPAQASSGNPFIDDLGISDQGSQLQDIGLGGPVGPAVASGPTHPSPYADVASRAELSAVESMERKKTIAAKQELLQRVTDPAVRARVQKQIDDLHVAEDPFGAGVELTNVKTEDRMLGSNLVRGLGAGAVNYGFLSVVDLGWSLLDIPSRLILSKEMYAKSPTRKVREALAEAQIMVRDDFFKPEGVEGLVGTVPGALIGGAKLWGKLNNAGLQAMMRIPKVGPHVARVVEKGLQPGATYLQRLAANAIGSGAVDAVQLVDVLANEELTDKEKAVSLATTVLLSGGAALWQAVDPVKAPLAKPSVDAEGKPTPPKPPPGSPDRAAEADAAAIKAQNIQLAKQRADKITRAGKAEWAANNPDKDWATDLSKAEKAAYLEEYRKRFAPGPDLDKAQATAAEPSPTPPPTAGEAGTELGQVPSGEAAVDPVQQAIFDRMQQTLANPKALADRLAAMPDEGPDIEPGPEGMPLAEPGKVVGGITPKTEIPEVSDLSRGTYTGAERRGPGRVADNVMSPEALLAVARQRGVLTDKTTSPGSHGQELPPRTPEAEAVMSGRSADAIDAARRGEDIVLPPEEPAPNPIDAQLAAMKEKVAKEGVPKKKADLSKVESSAELEVIAQRGKIVQDSEVLDVSPSDIKEEVLKRLDDVKDSIDEAQNELDLIPEKKRNPYNQKQRHFETEIHRLNEVKKNLERSLIRAQEGVDRALAEPTPKAAEPVVEAPPPAAPAAPKPKGRPKETLEGLRAQLEVAKKEFENARGPTMRGPAITKIEKLEAKIKKLEAKAAKEPAAGETLEAKIAGIKERVANEAAQPPENRIPGMGEFLAKTLKELEDQLPARTEPAPLAPTPDATSEPRPAAVESTQEPASAQRTGGVEGGKVRGPKPADTSKIFAGDAQLKRHQVVSEIDKVKGYIEAGLDEVDKDLAKQRLTSLKERLKQIDQTPKSEVPLDPAQATFRMEKLKSYWRKEPGKLPLEDLTVHSADIQEKMLSADPELKAQLDARLQKVTEAIAKKKMEIKGGKSLNAHHHVTAFAAGMGAGLMVDADDEQERWAHAMYGGMAALGASYGVTGWLRKMKQSADATVPDYQQRIRNRVKSVEDAPLEARVGFMTRLSRMYGNTVRRDLPISQISTLTGGSKMPASKSAGKAAELFGLWRGRTDRWIFGDRLSYVDKDGQLVVLPGRTLAQISADVQGDTRSVGDLAAARRELQLRTDPLKPRTTGISLEDARQMYRNSSESIHQGAEALHQYFRSLRDMAVASGLLSGESAAAMDAQEFYVAIRRIFGAEVGKFGEQVDVKGQATGSKRTGPRNLFRSQTGGAVPFQNPFEAAFDLTGPYMRNAEFNRTATLFFDEVSSMSYEKRKALGFRPVAKTKATPEMEARVLELQHLLHEGGTSKIDKIQAESILSMLTEEAGGSAKNQVKFYREGKPEIWEVPDDVAKAFKSLQPGELEMVLEGAGVITKLTNLARVGITANPVFVGSQALRDIWQFYINGAYAPAPEASLLAKVAQAPIGLAESAVSSMRGYLNIMFKTDAYKTYLDVGGGGESVASQGLRAVRGNIKQSVETLERVKQAPAKTQFHQIGREVKQMHWREAYASLLSPVADAGRFGAYLKERGRGSDVIESVYRTKKAGANFGNHGSNIALQALNRMTLFLNPALQGMDASKHAFTRDPTGYMIRNIAGVTIPSLMLWAAYKDDEEIVEKRSTANGNRYWWMRVSGHIVRIPKPIFEGQLFGASAEAWADHMYKKDPMAFRNWVQSMSGDAALNLLPLVGVIPTSLALNKDIGFGYDIVPESSMGLDVEYRDRANTSTLARIASKGMSPITRALDWKTTNTALSPAGIDYLVRQVTGGLGAESMTMMSQAYDMVQTNYVPALEELAFARQIFGEYPSMGVQSINEFYKMADKSEVASDMLEHLAETDPGQLTSFMENRQADLQTAELYAETKMELSDIRKAIEDIRQAPSDMMSPADKKELIQDLMRSMIDQARMTNQIARSIRTDIATTAPK